MARTYLGTVSLPVVLDHGYERDVDVDVYGIVVPYRPGQTMGDPADCYPEEGGCIDDLECKVVYDGNEVWLDEHFCNMWHDKLYEEFS